MTRTSNIRRNLIFNALKFATQLLLQFILRTILIYYMGAEYLGLNGLFTNIFAFLNLAELGIGGAIAFAMYKPIAENNIEQVKALQNMYKKFYLIISLIVLGFGIALIPFLKFLIKEDVSVDINIYILYVMYLINTIVGYFSAHKRSLLFAYQRNDVENKIKAICLIGMTIVQIAVIMISKNYYIFFTVNIVFTVLECMIIHKASYQLFPEINGKSCGVDKDIKATITKNVVALSMHKISGIIVYSTDNILISAILGVATLGVYSNYYLITASLVSMFYLFINSLIGSVGNLIASQDKEYVYSKYKQINFIFSIMATFATVALVVLFQPFMKIWTGGGEFMLDNSAVFLICASFYLMRMRNATLVFRDAAGLYSHMKFMPIVEAVINLVVSIVLAKLIGINGIFIGTIVSTLAVPFWVEPMVLYKHYFNKSVKSYFIQYAIDSLIMLVITFICYVVCSFIPSTGIVWLIVKFAVCIVLSLSLIALTYCRTKEFKELIKLIKNFCKKILKKTK